MPRGEGERGVVFERAFALHPREVPREVTAGRELCADDEAGLVESVGRYGHATNVLASDDARRD